VYLPANLRAAAEARRLLEGNDPEADRRTVAVLEAALQAMDLLQVHWRRSALNGGHFSTDEYGPEVVDHWVRTWHQKRVAAEGGTCAYGAGGGSGDRLAIAAMLADIEQATDRALADVLHWRSAQRVYLRQQREIPPWRRAADAQQEPPYPFGHWQCMQLIARRLGWRGYHTAAA
jgi:hypothetical protein